MKPFEERYTAWIDGRLNPSELEAFEAELVDRTEADADKLAAVRLGDLLRSHGTAPTLSNGDFFNHQIMERIAAGERPPVREVARPGRFTWSLPHLAWGSVCAVLLAVALYRTVVPTPVLPGVEPLSLVAQTDVPSEWTYNAEVVDARSFDPSISVTPLRSGQVSVLWVEGLEYLPASYELQ